MESTVQPRKCRKCGYFSGGWCYWLGRWRNPKQYECEDGYREDNPYTDTVYK